MYIHYSKVRMTKSMTTEDDFSQCLLLNTIKTARSMSRRYDARLKPYGVTVGQFTVMMLVRHNEGKPISAIAERIAMERTTLTRNIDLLTRKGLVLKEFAEKGNVKTCRLTNTGEALLDELIPVWHTARQELQTLLTGRDPDEYLAILQTLSKG